MDLRILSRAVTMQNESVSGEKRPVIITLRKVGLATPEELLKSHTVVLREA